MKRVLTGAAPGTACLWPRAILHLRLDAQTDSEPGRDRIWDELPDRWPTVAGSLLKVRGSRDLLDLTHCQSTNMELSSLVHAARPVLHSHFPGTGFALGVAPTAELARYASSIAGPGGIRVIAPWDVRQTIDPVPLWDVLPVTRRERALLEHAGVVRCRQMARMPLALATHQFGSFGKRLWTVCQGREIPEEVSMLDPTLERVLPPMTSSPRVLESYLTHMCARVTNRVSQWGARPSRLTIELEDSSRRAIRSEIPVPRAATDRTGLRRSIQELLEQRWPGAAIVRIRVAPMAPCAGGQQDLFGGGPDAPGNRVEEPLKSGKILQNTDSSVNRC